MASLTAREYQRVLDIVARLQTTGSLDEFVDVLLAELLSLLRGELAGWNEIDLVTGTLSGRGLPVDVAEPLYPIVSAHLAEHPLVQHFDLTGQPRSLRISDVVTPQEWQANPVYQQAFAPYGLTHQIAIPLLSTDRTLSAVAVNRGGRDFSARNKALLDTLAPLAAQIERERRWQDTLESSVAQASSGSLALMASDGTVVAASSKRGKPLSPDSAISDRARFHVVHTPSETTGTLPLTPKQMDALLAVADGSTAAAAARRIGVSTRTLDKHLQAAYTRLQVSGRIAALIQLRQAGVLK